MELLIAPILFIAAVFYVAYPLLRQDEEAVIREKEKTERERLLEHKEDVIANLKDVEMDYRMGKLSAEDYQSLKMDFEQQAVEAFRKLESLEEPRKSRKKKS